MDLREKNRLFMIEIRNQKKKKFYEESKMNWKKKPKKMIIEVTQKKNDLDFLEYKKKFVSMKLGDIDKLESLVFHLKKCSKEYLDCEKEMLDEEFVNKLFSIYSDIPAKIDKTDMEEPLHRRLKIIYSNTTDLIYNLLCEPSFQRYYGIKVCEIFDQHLQFIHLQIYTQDQISDLFKLLLANENTFCWLVQSSSMFDKLCDIVINFQKFDKLSDDSLIWLFFNFLKNSMKNLSKLFKNKANFISTIVSKIEKLIHKFLSDFVAYLQILNDQFKTSLIQKDLEFDSKFKMFQFSFFNTYYLFLKLYVYSFFRFDEFEDLFVQSEICLVLDSLNWVFLIDCRKTLEIISLIIELDIEYNFQPDKNNEEYLFCMQSLDITNYSKQVGDLEDKTQINYFYTILNSYIEPLIKHKSVNNSTLSFFINENIISSTFDFFSKYIQEDISKQKETELIYQLLDFIQHFLTIIPINELIEVFNLRFDVFCTYLTVVFNKVNNRLIVKLVSIINLFFRKMDNLELFRKKLENFEMLNEMMEGYRNESFENVNGNVKYEYDKETIHILEAMHDEMYD